MARKAGHGSPRTVTKEQRQACLDRRQHRADQARSGDAELLQSHDERCPVTQLRRGRESEGGRQRDPGDEAVVAPTSIRVAPERRPATGRGAP